MSWNRSATIFVSMELFFDQRNITSLADWQTYIHDGLAHSRLFLAFLSPRYFASEWCRREWRTWIDIEIAKHILGDGVDCIDHAIG